MRVLRLAPWRRGPLLLARRPGVALALFAAALVASLPAAAAPMFLSSAQHATLHRQIGETCQWRVGAQFTGPVSPADPALDRVAPDDAALGRGRYEGRIAALAARPVPGLTAPVSSGYAGVDAELVGRPPRNPDLTGLTLLARPGFEDQVEPLSGPAGTGLWLPHEYAQAQGIRVGDELVLSRRGTDPGVWTADQLFTADPAPATVTLPVAAIYRDLRTVPATPPYWCGVEDVYAGSSAAQADPDAVILPTALLDAETLLSVGERTRLVVEQTVELAPIDPRLDTTEAARLAAAVEALRAAMVADHPALFPTYRLDNTAFVSELPRYERRAALVRDGLLPPVLPITAAGTLVGLAVAGAAAVFWVQRRRQELVVLSSHGVGTGALGVKAVTEALPPVVVGAAAGWATAWALVAGVGPSAVLAPGLPALAGAIAAGTGVLALLLIGGLAAGGTRGLTDARPVSHGVSWWRRVPWELTLVAGAAAGWLLLAEDEVSSGAGGVGTVAHVPARLLVAPILIIGGLAVFAARLTARRLRRRGLARTPRRPAGLLAWRRSVRVAATTAMLAAATAVPVAMAVFGATATDSIRTTADAQLRYSLGSDTVIGYGREVDREVAGIPTPVIPDSLAGRSTEVLRLQQQRLGGLIVDVLAVDPATFTDGAFWDARIPGDSLGEAVARLSAGDTPQVIASRRIPPGPATLTVRDEDIPVTVAATQPVPGAQPAYPLVLVDRGALERHLSERALSSFSLEIWIAGDPEATRDRLAAAGLPIGRVNTVDDLRRGALHEPVTYTFQYLIALSIFTGLIGAVGLLLYLESRTAAHRRGYVMLRRLGLPPGAHRRALLLEVGGPVLAGLAAGLAGAAALAYGLRAGFDLDPDRFPAALIALPAPIAAAVSGAALAIAAGAGLLAHARIARAHPAEVLRDA